MKDTLSIVGKEPKFAPIEVLITNQNFFKVIPMNRLKTLMRLGMRLFVVLLSAMTTLADAKNAEMPRVSPNALQNISLYAALKTATVGDLVTIEITTGGFVDVEDFSIPIRWNSTLLTFQSVNGITSDVAGLTAANFNTTSATTGLLTANWMGSPSTLSDGSPFFSITFRVAAYSGTPASVIFNNIGSELLIIHTIGGDLATVTPRNGQVRINDASYCPPRPAGLTCQTAPVLNSTEFPYSSTLPVSNTQTVPTRGNICPTTVDNNHWIAFIASSTILTIKVKTLSCNGTGDGVHFFVYETLNCDTFQKVDGGCNQGSIPSGSEANATLTGLVVGNKYYIMVDGYTADVCEYNISIVSGQVFNSTQAIPAQTITGEAPLCGARTGLTYSIPTVASADMYLWRIPNSATATTPLSGATQRSIGVNWGNVSDSVCVKIVFRCDTTKWFCKSVKVGTTVTNEMTITKCPQAPYFFKGQNRFVAGDYRDTLVAASGCDSIILLHLLNYPPVTKEITVSKCAKAPYFFKGANRFAAGDYRDTLTTAALCDSIVLLHLLNYPPVTKEITVSKCANAPYFFKGQNRFAAGDYRDTLTTAALCDSIVLLHLLNYPPVTKEITVSKCANGPYFFKGVNRFAAGDYRDTLTTAALCDSIVLLHLLNYPPVTKDTTITKCSQTCYNFGGIDRCAAGDYTATFRNFLGCDSVVTLHLLNATAITKDLTITKCPQDCYTFNGQIKCSTGDYRDTLRTASGCDSIVILHLFNHPSATKSIDTTVCLGTSVIVGGRSFTIANNYTVTVTRGSSLGCDSIISLRLNVIDFLVTASKSSEITCQTPQATLSSRIQNQPPTATVTYEWRNASNMVIGTTPSVSVSQAGTFTLTAFVTFNGRTCSKSTTIAVTKSGTQPDKPTVTGQFLSCNGRTEVFLVPTPAANIDSFNWTVTNGTFTKQNTQISATWNANATTAKVCVNAQNVCGVSDTACISVEIGSIPASLSIVGTASVCPDAVVTYRVTQAPNTTLLWSVVGGTAQNALTTDSLRIRWAMTNGRVTVTPSNRCGTRTPTELNVLVSTALPDSVPIQGLATVCSTDTTTYTVANSATTTEYIWQVPTGATILRGQNSRTITVVWGSFSGNGQLFLTTKNACQLARGIGFPILVKNAALAAPTINGSRTVCPNTQISFSTPLNPDIRSYAWTVPADASILRGQGTDSVRVNWDIAPSGQVCLDVENACGVRRRTCINVEVRADLDSLVIAGGSIVCKDSTLQFCVPDDGNTLRFLWQIPTITGGTIVSGQGTRCINVRFASTGGTVRVTPVGGCSDGKLSRRDVTVKLPPTIIGTISGKNIVCTNAIETYSIAQQIGVSRYSWNLPTGTTLIGDSTRNTVTINIGNSTGGFLTVRAENDCGLGGGVTLRISVVQRPQVNAGVDTAFCGKIGVLKGSSNGATKTWGVVSKPSGATVSFSFPDRSQTRVSVSKSGTYLFRFEEANSADCSMADSVSIIFRDVPTATIVDQTCNQEATQYRVQLTVAGNAPPFSLGGSAFGTFQGNTFLSDTIGSGASYFFLVTDTFGCKSDTVRGVKTCPCYTSAGTLQVDSFVVCFGSTGRVTPVGDAKLDGNDIFEYVLHDGSPTTIGTVLLRNQTGVFGFAPSLSFNRTYYIAFVVGDQQNGQVDRTKRCASQTRGIPIVFKDKFTAGITGDTAVCRFSPAKLRFKTNQLGFFDVTYRADSGVIAFALGIQNNANINITPSVSATYKLMDVSDKNGCKAQITDSVRINLRPLPTANAGVDRSVCNNRIQLDAAENLAYVGKWTSLTAGVQITDPTNARSVVKQLQNGRNIFIWTVNDTACLDYAVRDTVQIFLPLVPKAINLSLITKMGIPVTGNVSESAPIGTYSVTRLTNPTSGSFNLFSNGSFTYVPEPKFEGVVTFRYIICSDSCTQLCDTGTVRILIQATKDTVKVVKIDVPNAITPNDDGKNDALVIDGLDQFAENELTIFNRWGDILYKSKPYRNDWRGTNQNGDPLPEGTYYYVLRLNTADGKILRGDMTVLR